MNSLAITANDATHVASAKLQLEDRSSAARNFREHHVIRKLNKLSNDELEKFSHAAKLTMDSSSHNYGATVNTKFTRINTNFTAVADIACRGRRSSRGRIIDPGYNDFQGAHAPSPAGDRASAINNLSTRRLSYVSAGVCVRSDSGATWAVAVCFLFFLIKLRTVSEGWAPLLIQYSARSSLIVLLWPGFFGSYVPMISINFPSRGLRLSATTTL